MDVGNVMDMVKVLITTYAFKVLAAIIVLIVGKWIAKKLPVLYPARWRKEKVRMKRSSSFCITLCIMP